MIWQYSPYFIPFVACGLITAILALTAWRNRSYVCAKPFTLLMCAVTLWSFATALSVASADLPTQMMAINIEYIGIVIVPVAWLLFAFEYTGREHWITKSNLALLFAVPVITVIVVATNYLHHLFYISITEGPVEGLMYPDITYGPFFWFSNIYSYILIYLAVMFILQRFVSTEGLYRGQMVAILIAVFTPFYVSLAYAVRQIGFLVIDPTPFAFIISGFAIIIGMMRYQLLDVTPMAQDQVIENMRDGMAVLDMKDRIISLNKSAETFVGMPLKLAVGVSIPSLLPDTIPVSEQTATEKTATEQVHEVEREIDGKKQYFELWCKPILSRGNNVKGKLILIRDITNQKVAEIALSLARKKLNLLSSITRHDILNQITVLLLNIDTVKDVVKDPEVLELLKIQENAVLSIQHQIEFARDYEDLGEKAPQWMNINLIFSHLVPVMGVYGIALVSIKDELEIYADQLLERVFYNLMDNSIHHGKHVTTISICYEKTAAGLILVYEDNGEGVQDSDKQRIFERGFGKHTGLGLFLTQEILEITGMRIKETGTFGKGARFEIYIPEKQYRMVKRLRDMT